MKNLTMSFGHLPVIKSSAFSLLVFVLVISLSAFIEKNNDPQTSTVSSARTRNHKLIFQNNQRDSSLDPSRYYATKLNSHAVPFVVNYIRVEGGRLGKMKVWGKNYFELYDQILNYYGLPKQLK